jgi:hypothetical protein
MTFEEFVSWYEHNESRLDSGQILFCHIVAEGIYDLPTNKIEEHWHDYYEQTMIKRVVNPVINKVVLDEVPND